MTFSCILLNKLTAVLYTRLHQTGTRGDDTATVLVEIVVENFEESALVGSNQFDAVTFCE